MTEDIESYLPDLTIASALEGQRESVAALRRRVINDPDDVSACKELSMACKRLGEMIKMYLLEQRLQELEQQQ